MRGRLTMIALGTMVAAALAACGDDPPVAKGGPAQAAQGPAPAPQAPEAAVPRVDENAALAARVIAALRRDPTVGKLGIDVVSAEGAVTLFGTAPSNRDRDRAARVAAGVDGVRSVLNNLVIVAGS